MLAALALSSSLTAQNYITFGGEYKTTNSRFNQGFGLDVGMQFAISERLTIGPQIGYNYFEYDDEWSAYTFGTGIGDDFIEQVGERQSVYGGASAHYLLLGLNSKLKLHVGLGLNCHIFRQLEEWSGIGSSGNNAFARLEAELPMRAVYTPNEDKRLSFFTSVIPGYLVRSSAHEAVSYHMGSGIGMLSFRAGLQIGVGKSFK